MPFERHSCGLLHIPAGVSLPRQPQIFDAFSRRYLSVSFALRPLGIQRSESVVFALFRCQARGHEPEDFFGIFRGVLQCRDAYEHIFQFQCLVAAVQETQNEVRLTEAGVGVAYQPKAQGGQGAGILLDASLA